MTQRAGVREGRGSGEGNGFLTFSLLPIDQKRWRIQESLQMKRSNEVMSASLDHCEGQLG